MADISPEPIAPGRPWQRVALGLFILFQLAYLPIANVIKLYPRRLPASDGELTDDIQARGRAFDAELPQRALDALGDVIDRYGELTGEIQGWSLFAPRFGHHASLPIVEASYRDGRSPAVLRSRFAPNDPDRYFRWPSRSCRLWNYEARVAMLYVFYDEATMAARPTEWRDAVVERVREQRRSLNTYAMWRFVEEFGVGAIEDVDVLILKAELIPARPLDNGPRASISRIPVARFRKLTANDPLHAAVVVDAYDPAAREWVRAWEGEP